MYERHINNIKTIGEVEKMFRTSATSKTFMTFGTMAIAGVMLLFAAGPVIGNPSSQFGWKRFS
jgi:hypothetical protein